MSLPYFATTDLIKWGAGTGIGALGTLSPQQADLNIWGLHTRLEALEDLELGIGFATDTGGKVVAVGNQLTFRFSDSSEENVIIPLIFPTGGDEWLPSTFMPAFRLFSHEGAGYIVQWPHVSGLTFDPNANDGTHNYYFRFFSTPDDVLTGVSFSTDGPQDGDTLIFDGENWVNTPFSFSLDGLSDVLTAGAAAGDVLKYVGTDGWIAEAVDFSELTGQLTPQQFPAGQQPLRQFVSTATDGSLTIDLALGKSVHVTLDQDVTAVIITGWPTAGILADFILTITNAGGFDFLNLPEGTLEVDEEIPTIPSSGKTRWHFTTDDAGATLYLDVLGAGYGPITP